MKLVTNISEKELRDIKRLIGEAFVTNELFHEFGGIAERRTLVMRYMRAYVDYVYESRALYSTNNGMGYIGLQYSEDATVISQIKMLFRLFTSLPFKRLRKLLGHIRQIANENKRYATKPHIDVLMVAVSKSAQGKGYATQLISFAKRMAGQKQVPLLVDTDMKLYADMYQHLGFKLYNTKKATNGVTRYNLVWKPAKLSK
ncbi:GNAT family N-acetyltransferase [Ruminococcus sp.]|uniref:GNAT family N-acetyltransferase n=1 Tax=Ruminococcus sp. TaxID=41978 RepID=UPI0025EAF7BA|nr:GNAT family N-acetyltransferase [Ruminococcus sp.]